MKSVRSDYVLHPPGGCSSLPGNPPANPYVNYPPKELKEMILKEADREEKKKMLSALKQWERVFTYPGYPWRAQRANVAARFLKLSELINPAINIPYYQETETPQGQEEIVDGLKSLYDNDNAERFDYTRQGIRPIRDIDTADGDFLTPSEPPMGPVVKERGDGPDPEGMECQDPPTGGDIDTF
jgi:hypothetical protein